MLDEKNEGATTGLLGGDAQDPPHANHPKKSSHRRITPMPSPVMGSLPSPPLSAQVSGVMGSGGLSILAYCLSSISMTLVNKFVVSGHSWNLHLLYLAIQHIICSVAILACKYAGLIKDMDGLDYKRSKQWFPIAMLLVVMIFTGNRALQFLSVPVFTICKNLAVIATAYGEVFFFGGSVTPLSFLAFSIMIFSSVVAAWSDFSHAHVAAAANVAGTSVSSLHIGYFWMVMNVFAAASYALGMRGGIKTVALKNWDVMYYNNVLTIPVLLVGSLVFEDWSSENLQANFPPEARQGLIVGMIYSGMGALFISYCTAWCIRATSSTTYAMAGALNKLPTAIAGLIFFADPVTFGSVTAIFLGFVSGIMYTVAKRKAPKPEKPSVLPTSNFRPKDQRWSAERDGR